jgi:hypothetical protein
MESDAVTLVKGDLGGILRARQLSHARMRNITHNPYFAFIYNGVGLLIAAGALYALVRILLSPMIAAAAMSFSSVSVIVNALRLRGVDLRDKNQLERLQRAAMRVGVHGASHAPSVRPYRAPSALPPSRTFPH